MTNDEFGAKLLATAESADVCAKALKGQQVTLTVTLSANDARAILAALADRVAEGLQLRITGSAIGGAVSADPELRARVDESMAKLDDTLAEYLSAANAVVASWQGIEIPDSVPDDWTV